MKIFLIGFMGAGKSWLGKKLAIEMNLPFYDIDLLIEQKMQLPVSEIFSIHGEDKFRQLETQILSQLSKSSVIATGAGIIKKSINREILLSLSDLTIWLNTAWEECYQRIKNSQRPLVQNHTRQELYNLYIARSSLYKSLADFSWYNADAKSLARLIKRP